MRTNKSGRVSTGKRQLSLRGNALDVSFTLKKLTFWQIGLKINLIRLFEQPSCVFHVLSK